MEEMHNDQLQRETTFSCAQRKVRVRTPRGKRTTAFVLAIGLCIVTTVHLCTVPLTMIPSQCDSLQSRVEFVEQHIYVPLSPQALAIYVARR